MFEKSYLRTSFRPSALPWAVNFSVHKFKFFQTRKKSTILLQVTAKPDLYPLVIGYDDSFGKGTSGLVMRYFRSLSHASTLDSLSSSFMCNVVNEANTIVPPPYSCNNSIDELSSTGTTAMVFTFFYKLNYNFYFSWRIVKKLLT